MSNIEKEFAEKTKFLDKCQYESGGFGWTVKVEDIDWKAYRKGKG